MTKLVAYHNDPAIKAKYLARIAALDARVKVLEEAVDLSEQAMRADLQSEIESACCRINGEYVRDTADPGAEPWLQAKERALEAIDRARAALGEG
jgi:hypothetical protein